MDDDDREMDDFSALSEEEFEDEFGADLDDPTYPEEEENGF